MKKTLIAMMLLAAGSAFAESRFSIGIGIGAPAYYPPARVVVAARPPCPGPGYTWTDGYYDSYGSWTGGYWAPPAYYVAPAPQYYGGYYRRDWDRGRDWDRDRRYDRDRDRRYGGDRDHDRDRGREVHYRR